MSKAQATLNARVVACAESTDANQRNMEKSMQVTLIIVGRDAVASSALTFEVPLSQSETWGGLIGRQVFVHVEAKS